MKQSSRFNGLGVLLALVVSSALAYVWPHISNRVDPFHLPAAMLLALVAVTMFCLGLVVHPEELHELRRRPLAVLLGVLVQCTLMPAMAWLVVRSLGLQGDLAIGVLLAGCVPGAMASNVLTLTARGNVSYSVSLTTVATLLSPLTVPLVLTLIAGISGASDVIQPWRMAWVLIASVVAPVIVGYELKRRWKTLRQLASSVASPLATIALLWIIASVVAGNRERLAEVHGDLLVGLLVMNVAGYFGGYAMGQVFKMPEAMRRALTLEVGMQNAGLGTVLAANLLGSDSVAQIPTAAYTFGCMLTGTILAALWSTQNDR